MEIKKILLRKRFTIISVVCGLALWGACVGVLVNYKAEVDATAVEEVRHRLHVDLEEKAALLGQKVTARSFYNNMAEAVVKGRGDVSREGYTQLVSDVATADTLVQSIAISKQGIIIATYPVEGFESALGTNLLTLPSRKNMVLNLVREGKSLTVGPNKMIVGDTGIMCYKPLYTIDKKTGKEKWWGFADVAIKIPKLFEVAGLSNENGIYRYAMRGKDARGAQGDFFYGDKNVYSEEPVSVDVHVPGGTWLLSAVPANGWAKVNAGKNMKFVGLHVLAFLFAVSFGRAIYVTQVLRDNKKKIYTTLAGIRAHIFNLDIDGNFIRELPTGSERTILPENVEGTNLRDYLDRFGEENVAIALETIRKAIDTRKLQVRELEIGKEGEKIWTEVRMNRLDSRTVVVVAYNITERKLAELARIESEKTLRSLNAQKDKFFSIIAHDLRNPILGQKAALDMLNKDYDEITDEDKKEYIGMLQQSATQLSKLLENLLTWSRVEVGKIVFTPSYEDVRYIINDCISQAQQTATNKKITLKAEFDHKSKMLLDVNMMSAIVRNLVSNALKFTPEGGKITVSTREDAGNMEIVIRDTGVGMSEQAIASLFKIDSTKSTRGTNQEVGTGLGLILCKEFIGKHDGTVDVWSEVGKGSAFIMTFPIRGEEPADEIAEKIDN